MRLHKEEKQRIHFNGKTRTMHTNCFYEQGHVTTYLTMDMGHEKKDCVNIAHRHFDHNFNMPRLYKQTNLLTFVASNRSYNVNSNCMTRTICKNIRTTTCHLLKSRHNRGLVYLGNGSSRTAFEFMGIIIIFSSGAKRGLYGYPPCFLLLWTPIWS